MPGHFSSPESIIVDSEGYIYVCDTCNNLLWALYPIRSLLTFHVIELEYFTRINFFVLVFSIFAQSCKYNNINNTSQYLDRCSIEIVNLYRY